MKKIALVLSILLTLLPVSAAIAQSSPIVYIYSGADMTTHELSCAIEADSVTVVTGEESFVFQADDSGVAHCAGNYAGYATNWHAFMILCHPGDDDSLWCHVLDVDVAQVSAVSTWNVYLPIGAK